MSEGKKRFPRWLIICALLLVPFAAVLGLIETVGRQGALVGRYELIKEGMSRAETYRILGRPPDTTMIAGLVEVWIDRPFEVYVVIPADGRVRDVLTYRLHDGNP
jgi:hypothetical protein